MVIQRDNYARDIFLLVFRVRSSCIWQSYYAVRALPCRFSHQVVVVSAPAVAICCVLGILVSAGALEPDVVERPMDRSRCSGADAASKQDLLGCIAI